MFNQCFIIFSLQNETYFLSLYRILVIIAFNIVRKLRCMELSRACAKLRRLSLSLRQICVPVRIYAKKENTQKESFAQERETLGEHGNDPLNIGGSVVLQYKKSERERHAHIHRKASEKEAKATTNESWAKWESGVWISTIRDKFNCSFFVCILFLFFITSIKTS